MKPLNDLIAQAAKIEPPKDRFAPGALSPGEEKVVSMIAKGDTDKVIARREGKSHTTVRYQVYSAKRKLGAKTRAQLISIWLKSAI